MQQNGDKYECQESDCCRCNTCGFGFGRGCGGQVAFPSLSGRGIHLAATNIVFKQWTVDVKGTKSQQFAVTDPDEVRRLASCVRLGVETRNKCEFLQQAKFEGLSGVLYVQFNEHYFVVVDPPSSKGYSDRTYEMPKQFYAQFHKLAKKHPWKVGKS